MLLRYKTALLSKFLNRWFLRHLKWSTFSFCLSRAHVSKCWHYGLLFLWSQSWQIGTPPTGGQDGMRLSRRSRIGHTFLTHSFILAGDCPPQCEHCQCKLAACHILVRCPHLRPVRDGVFGNEAVIESFRFHPQTHYTKLEGNQFLPEIHFSFLTRSLSLF